MSRLPSLIDRLETASVLSAVDAALGRLIAVRSERDGDLVGVVTALASAALAQGHSCVPLNSLHSFIDLRLADALRNGDSPAQPVASNLLPPVEQIRAALRASPWVARDGAAAAAVVFDVHDRIYLRRYFNYERDIADALLDRVGLVESADSASDALGESLRRYFDRASGDQDQCIAALLALRSRFLIITGGPGAGKTSTVLRVLAITLEQALAAGNESPRIALTAPTGKAAARLSESLRAPSIPVDDELRAALPAAATTLHRLLGVMPGRRRLRYDRDHPLPYDLVIVDEASMLDLSIGARLCAALAPTTRLILLGDRDQLASVEAGSVFGALCAAAGRSNRYSPQTTRWLQSILQDRAADLVASPAQSAEERFATNRFSQSRFADEQAADGSIGPSFEDHTSTAATSAQFPLIDALVELRSSHRFDESSAIGQFARAVRSGASEFAHDILIQTPLQLRSQVVPEDALARSMLDGIVPRFGSFAAADSPQAALACLERFRVLCALREGPFGAVALNALIEKELRRRSARVDAQGWFAGRLVMIRSNDYAQGLFNGDIGVAMPSGSGGEFEVWLRSADGTPRAIPPALLPAHDGAFALTVHKAQGSEFDEVLIVLPARDARVLTRELLYTAVTRARIKVELWTSGEILDATIARRTQRWSGLADALRKPVADRSPDHD